MKNDEIRRLYTRTISNRIRPLSVLVDSFVDACSQWEDITRKAIPGSLDAQECKSNEELTLTSQAVKRVSALASQVRCVQQEVSTKVVSSPSTRNVSHPLPMPESRVQSREKHSAGKSGAYGSTASKMDEERFFCTLSSSSPVEDCIRNVSALHLARNVCVFSMWLAIALGDIEWLFVTMSSAEDYFDLKRVEYMRKEFFSKHIKIDTTLGEKGAKINSRSATCTFFGHSCEAHPEKVGCCYNDREVVRVIIVWYHCFVGELLKGETLYFLMKKESVFLQPSEQKISLFQLNAVHDILAGNIHGIFQRFKRMNKVLPNSSLASRGPLTVSTKPGLGGLGTGKDDEENKSASYCDPLQIDRSSTLRRKSLFPYYLFLRLMLECVVRKSLVELEVGKIFRPVLGKVEDTEKKESGKWNSSQSFPDEANSRRLIYYLSSKEATQGAPAEMVSDALQLLFFKEKGGVWPFPSDLLRSLFSSVGEESSS